MELSLAGYNDYFDYMGYPSRDDLVNEFDAHFNIHMIQCFGWPGLILVHPVITTQSDGSYIGDVHPRQRGCLTMVGKQFLK
jgi:hypothetical protein